jgi:hypothetical protein
MSPPPERMPDVTCVASPMADELVKLRNSLDVVWGADCVSASSTETLLHRSGVPRFL